MNRLRELRHESGMTMKELANHFGVSEVTIHNYETGAREPGLDTLMKFAEYYRVTVDYILGAETNEKPVEKPFHMNDEEKLIIISYRKQSRETQLMIMKMLDIETRKQTMDGLAQTISYTLGSSENAVQKQTI